LQKLSWLKIKELVPAEIDTALLPIGTIEAHGSACIGTDNFIPEILAEDLAERVGALVMPTLNYGITKSLYRYNGSITINPDTFQLFVGDILKSMADTGFKNIIILNGHGGNNSSLKTAAFDFHRNEQKNIAVIHWWELCHDMTIEFFGHTGGHAGTDETAMVQAIDPKLADKYSFEEELAYYFRPGADVYPVPGSILLYKEGEGYPNFDIKQAKEYRKKVVETVGDFIELVLKRWQKFGL
jgi:creatinine amidohydrolase